MGVLTDLQEQALIEPFDASDVKRRIIDKKSGREASYLPAEVIIRRLTSVPYSFQIIRYWTENVGGKVVALCHGKLTIDGQSWEDIGTAFIHDNGSEEQWKSAQSDCIKRCARMRGIGLEMWEGDPNEATRGLPAYEYEAPPVLDGPAYPPRQNNYQNGGSSTPQNNGYARQQYTQNTGLGPSDKQVPFLKSLCAQKGLTVQDQDGQMGPDWQQLDVISLAINGKPLMQSTPKEVSNVIDEVKSLKDERDRERGVQV